MPHPHHVDHLGLFNQADSSVEVSEGSALKAIGRKRCIQQGISDFNQTAPECPPEVAEQVVLQSIRALSLHLRRR